MNLKKKSKISKIFSFKYFFYDFVKWTGAIPTLLYIRPLVKYEDKKAYKKLRGGFIISANHLQFTDPLILLCAFPKRRCFFMAMEKVFATKIKAWFFRNIHCVKVDRNNVGLDTIRNAGEEIQNEKVICIFPEGKLESEAVLEAFKPGCAMLSILNNVPILPVRLEKRKSFWNCNRVVVGKPIYPKDIVGEDKSLKAMDKLNMYLFETEKELMLVK